jgi:N4-gp56 family major capsid protein
MAAGVTKKSNMVVPQVMAAALEQKMIDAIKLTPLAVVNRELVGQGGDTVTVPYYAYIGDAADLAEGVAGSIDTLTASTKTATVKKVFKAVEITDEAMMSNFSDPVSEAEDQIATALAAKVEKDCYAAMEGVEAARQITDSGEISTKAISSAVIAAFGEDYEGVYLFVTPKQYHKIRTEDGFIHIASGQSVITGHVGEVYGTQIVVSNRVGAKNIMLKKGGLQIALKREVQVETDRDILKKTTVISADRHSTAFVYDANKVACVAFKATA